MDDLTDAIDPDLPATPRDIIQLYYLFGASLIEYFGGVDGVNTRFNFVRAWADFARGNREGVSYDEAYEFTSGLVSTYGDDYLRTLARGAGVVFWRGIDEDDVLDAEDFNSQRSRW